MRFAIGVGVVLLRHTALTASYAGSWRREATARTPDEFCNLKTVRIDRTEATPKPGYGLL